MVEGKGPEEHRVHHAEHRGGGPDPQGERQNRHRRESLVLPQLSQSVAQILPYRVEPLSPFHLPLPRFIDLTKLRPELRRIPELADRFFPCFLRTHPPVLELLRHFFHVKAELFVEISAL